jgi:hypothetical protein
MEQRFANIAVNTAKKQPGISPSPWNPRLSAALTTNNSKSNG